MDLWWVDLSVFLGLLLLLLFLGMPVFLAFFTVNLVGILYLVGFGPGMHQVIVGTYSSLAKFSLTPIPLFVLMGELLFQSGLATRALDGFSKWMGRIPGRLSILSVAAGTLFAAVSGSTLANTSMLGSMMVPEMRERGYSTLMTVGPILASGSLAMLIPPSAPAVLLGSIAQIPVGDLLIAGIVPGVLMALAFILYIVVVCWRHPELAPSYGVTAVRWRERLLSLVTDVAPLALIFLMVIGPLFAGVATPTESAALGALGALIILALYRRLNWSVVKGSLLSTLRISGMILMIVAGSSIYSQLLAYSGLSGQIARLVLDLAAPPWIIVGAMLVIVQIMGCFMEMTAIMMITLPLFMPVVSGLGVDPVWFGILMLIALDLGGLTPPFGMTLFVMKGVTPPEVTMGHIIRAAVPFIAVELVVLLVVFAFPSLAVWLPQVAKSG